MTRITSYDVKEEKNKEKERLFLKQGDGQKSPK